MNNNTYTLPLLNPHSIPPSNQIFYTHGVFKYAFSKLQAITSSLLIAASIKPIQMLSLEATLEYIITAKVLVVCPPAQNLAFLVKSILIPK
jgi:hypothetical protein